VRREPIDDLVVGLPGILRTRSAVDGVIIGPSRSSVAAGQLANIQASIAGAGVRVGQITVMP
jgi:hypothetical protein